MLSGLHLHLDCASGAAGDMMLGALIDLGVPIDIIGLALDAIGAGRDRLTATSVTKGGIASIDVKVRVDGTLGGAAPHTHDTAPGPDHPHEQGMHTHVHAHHADAAQDEPLHGQLQGHTHAHGAREQGAHAHAAFTGTRSHAHFHYGDIRARIVSAALTEGAKRRALEIFDRLARAEAKLHGTTVESVAFHEVGAIDSIVDVVGTAAALDWLSPASVTCSAVAMGHGTLTCAHGVLPVPAPAALEVLREAGGVMMDGGVARELCTPTGAAILAATVTAWTAAPAGVPVAIGWGAGDLDLADRANVLRITAIQPAAASDAIWQIDANLDDMSPELAGPAMDAVFAAGAVDAWWTPIMMKKGRPAFTLSALAPTGGRDAVIAAILRETTTIGVRFAPRERTVLARRTVEVTTKYGAIPVKIASAADGRIANAAPEYEACAAAARLHGVAVKHVYTAALAAVDLP